MPAATKSKPKVKGEAENLFLMNTPATLLTPSKLKLNNARINRMSPKPGLNNICATDANGLKSFRLSGDWTRRSIGSDSGNWKYTRDRKSTRLNSSHLGISYAVFCLKKKTKNI